MVSFAVLALFVAVGLPLAFALTRRWIMALALAPLITGLASAAAATVMVMVGGPFALWVAALLMAEMLLGWRILATRPAPLPMPTSWDLLGLIPLAAPFILLWRPPVYWDARSVWWFHASWFAAGGSAAGAALGNPQVVFSHPDYPPLLPAAIASAWTASGASSLRLAQSLGALLTLGALIVLALIVRQLAGPQAKFAGTACGLAVGLSAWAAAPFGPAGGYADHLWATVWVGAAALLLIDPETVDREGGRKIVLAAVLMSVAALVKTEGFLAVIMLAALFTLRSRRRWRSTGPVWVSVLAGGAWVVVSRLHGASSDLATSATVRLTQFKSGDFTALDRLDPIVAAMREQFGWLLVLGMVITILGVALLGRLRSHLGLASTWWIWALLGCYLATLVATFLLSEYDIAWHLGTALDRVTVPIMLLVAVNTASWVITAIGRPTAAVDSGPESGLDVGETPLAVLVRSES